MTSKEEYNRNREMMEKRKEIQRLKAQMHRDKKEAMKIEDVLKNIPRAKARKRDLWNNVEASRLMIIILTAQEGELRDKKLN